MSDACGELAERSKLFGLDQAVLRGAKVVQGTLELARLGLYFLEQADIAERDHRLIGEGLEQRDLLVAERIDLDTAQHDGPDALPVAQQRDADDGAMPHPQGQIRSEER